MDLDDIFLTRTPPVSPRAPQCFEARVVEVTERGSMVVMPQFDRQLMWGPCSPADARVEVGDEVTVVMSDRGTPWLVGAPRAGSGGGDGGSAADLLERLEQLEARVERIGEEAIGSVKAWSGASIPAPWMLCDGRSLNQSGASGYPLLYAVLGSTWGSGAGTFNIPDLRGRMLIGTGAAVAGQTSARALAERAGAESVTLTGAQSGVAAHGHALSGSTGAQSAQHGHGLSGNVPRSEATWNWTANASIPSTGSNAWAPWTGAGVHDHLSATAVATTDHTHAVGTLAVGQAGVAAATASHENMPPWVAIGLVIKADR